VIVSSFETSVHVLAGHFDPEERLLLGGAPPSEPIGINEEFIPVGVNDVPDGRDELARAGDDPGVGAGQQRVQGARAVSVWETASQSLCAGATRRAQLQVTSANGLATSRVHRTVIQPSGVWT